MHHFILLRPLAFIGLPVLCMNTCIPQYAVSAIISLAILEMEDELSPASGQTPGT